MNAKHAGNNGGGTKRADIAVIGMSCLFPKAPDLAAFWQNIVSKVDAITDPPADWEGARYFDPESDANDRIYCMKGGYLGDLARFNPLENGVMPTSLDGGEPDHYLALRVAREALADSGYLERPFDPHRAEVILGRGTYVNRGVTNLVQHGLVIEQTLEILRGLHPEHTDEEILAIKKRLKAALPPFTAETAPSLVPNIVSGRIANRLNFMGPNYLIDAACASSLLAVQHAMRDLRDGVCDLALAGGVHASTPPLILMIFCQINALSRRSRMRPFDREADGTLLGEGIGVIALKRREDAERDGDRIYALLKEIGTASDGRALGLLAPRLEGEELAIRRAYEGAGIDPRTVELIEAHGTATPIGDATEIQALGRVFGTRDADGPACGLGTVKSMISHTIPASGIAGLIKTALSLYHRVLPPTLHCEHPNPALGLEKTPFYINTETRPWIHGNPDAPRRAGVNAFGFGGVNAHAILEEYPETEAADTPSLHRHWESEALSVQGDTREELRTGLADLKRFLERSPQAELVDIAHSLSLRPAGRYRLGLVAADVQDLSKKLDFAQGRLADPQCRRIKERSGIYFFEEPLGPRGKIAFMFPGEGSQYPDMLADLCLHFPEVRRSFDLMDRAFHGSGQRPSRRIFPPPRPGSEDPNSAEEALFGMEAAAQSVFAASRGLAALLRSLSVRPDVVVGHSTGEYSALLAAGALVDSGEESILSLIRGVHGVYGPVFARGGVPEGSLLAVGGGDRGKLESVLREHGGRLEIAMDNCPHQAVLCGPPNAVSDAARSLASAGFICTPLRFQRPYHTARFEPVCAPLRAFFATQAFATPALPLYSCTTTEPYPADPEAVRDLAALQWARPVRFRETMHRMAENGVRIFIEVGPSGNLTGFVDDALRGRDILAAATNLPRRSGLTQINHLAALLSAHHVSINLSALYRRRNPRTVRFDQIPDRKAAAELPRIPLVLPRLRLNGADPRREIPEKDRAALPATSGNGNDSSAPYKEATPSPAGQGPSGLDDYFKTMEAFLQTQERVMAGYLGTAAGIGDTAPSSPETIPEAANPAARSIPGPHLKSSPAPAVDRGSQIPVSGTRPVDQSRPDVPRLLAAIVADKTGYPAEMLKPGLNMESELGIDSIKRVEILGALRRKLDTPLEAEAMEKASRLKTLKEVADFFEARMGTANSPSTAPVPVTEGPLVGRLESFQPGREAVAFRTFQPDNDLFLLDHTLGGRVSESDPALTALPVVPLTVSMETLAQVGGQLAPGLCLVAMKNVRAYRWIALDGGKEAVRTTARRIEGSADTEVQVRMEAADGSELAENGPSRVLIEAHLVFSDQYPRAPEPLSFDLDSPRPSSWTPESLYTGFMFHGPRFQAVASVDRTAENGTEATLRTLPLDRLFRSGPAVFHTDPVLLDAAGQVVAYWTGERLKEAFHIFPYFLERLELYGPPPAAGVSVQCRADIRLLGEAQVRSDIDLIAPGGRVYARMIGWEDRRFHLPDAFFRVRVDPKSEFLSRTMPQWAPGASPDNLQFAFLEEPGDGLLEAHGRIWSRVLARLTLSRREQAEWAGLRVPDKRRREWLLGRVAVKEAVRRLLLARGLDPVYPADIEVAADEKGRPSVSGHWTQRLGETPAVSIAHSQGTAVGLAALTAGIGIGVDLEPADRLKGGPEDLHPAFHPDERIRLQSLGGPDAAEWPLRLWCAKEAAAKASGRGLMGRPQDIVATEISPGTGEVRLTSRGPGPGHDADPAEREYSAVTRREGRWIIAYVNPCTEEGKNHGTQIHP